MRTTRTRLLLTALLLVGVHSSAWGQSNTGTALGAFLKIGTSARSAGMGNAGAGLAEGIESVYYNPAAIGALHQTTAQFSRLIWFADIDIDYAAVALPVRGWGTFFGSVTALRSGDIDVRTVDKPLGTGERFDVSNVALSLGFGRRVTGRFIVGGQLNLIHERIWNSSHNTATVSVGTVYLLTDGGIKLGSCLSNLGTRSGFSGRDLAIQFDGDPFSNGDNGALPADQFTGDFPVPLLFRIGLQIPYEISQRNRLLFLLDALHPNDNTESLNAGGEWLLANTLSLRAGYQTLFQDDSEMGLTFGFGLRRDRKRSSMRVDYGWADHDRLSSTHRVSVALAF